MKSSGFIFLVLLGLTIVHEISAERILALSFFSSKSHRLTYFPLLEELAKRGHEVTYLSPIKGGAVLKNLREVFTVDIDGMMSEFNLLGMKEAGKEMDPVKMTEMVVQVCKMTYDRPEVREILKQKFDLVFLPALFNDCVLGIVHQLGLPFVLFSPAVAFPTMISKLGGHLPPSFVPSPMLGYSDEMTFYQRFVNFGVNALITGVFDFFYEPAMTQVYRDKLGDPTLPPVREILGHASLALINSHFSLVAPRPYLPDVIDVGGLHSQPAKPLPKDLEDFVSGNKEGFILFSLGTAVRGSQMTEEKRKMFLSAFSKLSQNVLWKWETESMPDLPKNVKLSKWLPQQDLLGHPKIKLFITHCGGGSTEESIYHGVPLVGVPIFGDQHMNSRTAMQRGYLVELDYMNLSEERISTAINEVIGNAKYRENVERLSKVFKDQPDHPLNRAVYWVEYVLRHKGAPHLRSAGRKLNYFQYHSFDIIATYLLIFTIVIYVIYIILRTLLNCLLGLCGGKKESKELAKKKRN